MKTLFRTFALTVACAAFLTACGGGNEPNEAAEAPAEPAAAHDALAATAESTPEPAPAAEPEHGAPTATLYRDTWGVPHIYSDDLGAGMYAVGYAQAEDRLSDIYDAVRTGLGLMSEVYGKELIEQDVYMRISRNEELAKEQWDNATPEMRVIGERFVEGIKAYEAEHPDEVYPNKMEIEPWMLSTIGRAMIMRWPLGTIADEAKRMEKPETPDNPAGASNQWSVAASRSADGVPILLTDPHLSWEGLSVFYEMRVHAGPLHMNGYAVIGSPIIGFGHSNHVGWAPTTGGPDTADVYMVKVRQEGFSLEYEYDGEWRKAKPAMINVPVKDGEPHKQPTAYTHLGPIIAPPDEETGIALVGATPYFDTNELFEQFLKMCLARDANEFYDALSMNQYMEQNCMYADTSGNIGYVRVGRTPIRPEGYDFLKPVPGWTSETAWKGIHPIEDLVQALNPAAGYMQNCNIAPANMMVDSPMTPDKYPSYIYNVSWDGNNPRGKRAVQVLDADDSVTKDEAIELALHTYDILAKPWQKAVASAWSTKGADFADNAKLAAFVEAFAAWDGEFRIDKTVTNAYKFWRLKQSGDIINIVVDGGELNEDLSTALLASIAETLDELEAKYGNWDIPWGDVHKVGRGGTYYPVGGADFGGRTDGPNFTETLYDVRSSESKENPGTYVADNGTMALMLMFMHEDGIDSYSLTPWGQSGHPDSPHYMDQGEKLYSPRKVKATWWQREDLEGNIESEKVFKL